MAVINYDIIIVTEKRERLKKYRKLNGLIIKHNGNSFKLRVNTKFKYSEAVLKEMLYDAAIIDTKQFENDIIETINFFNNQAEIFIYNYKDKPNILHKNVKYFSEDDDLAREMIEFFFNRRYNTPFFNQLKRLARSKKQRWHTPGHVGGEGFEKWPSVRDFKRFYKNNIFLTDTSVSDPSFGSLLSHTGGFKDAEKLMANAYGAIASFVNVHGTSTSNKVLFMSLLNTGDKVIVDRNMHKSIIHSIIVSGAFPVFLKANFNSDFGIILPTRKEILFKQIEENKDAKLLALTVPTYDGLRYYLPDIIEFAHSFGIKVHVDEAWGAHMHFHPDFYPDALQSGADYVVQSVHKTMGGFSQSSVIHVNDKDFGEIKRDFYENYMFFSSTSPFYPMVASIDVARKMMAVEGKQILDRMKKFYEILVEEIDKLEDFKVLKKSYLKNYFNDINEILIDYSRIVVNFAIAGISKKQMWNYLVKNNIIVEKINYKSFTLLLGTGTTINMVRHMIKVLKAFKKEEYEVSDESMHFNWDDILVKNPPYEAYQSEGEWLDIRQCEGRVSSNMLVPYPPGIPLIIPGQILTRTIIDNIVKVTSSDDIEIHGLAKGKIKVVKERK